MVRGEQPLSISRYSKNSVMSESKVVFYSAELILYFQFAKVLLCELILNYHLSRFLVKCPISYPNFTYFCFFTQGGVILSTRTKVVIKLLESKKLSFAALPRQPGAKALTKLTFKKRGI
jgi:hypothetical protein